jgi:DNA polymerase V
LLILVDDEEKRGKIEKLENAMSLVSQNLGRNTIFYAALGTRRNWAMQSNNRSPSYTTNIKEIPLVS